MNMWEISSRFHFNFILHSYSNMPLGLHTTITVLWSYTQNHRQYEALTYQLDYIAEYNSIRFPHIFYHQLFFGFMSSNLRRIIITTGKKLRGVFEQKLLSVSPGIDLPFLLADGSSKNLKTVSPKPLSNTSRYISFLSDRIRISTVQVYK